MQRRTMGWVAGAGAVVVAAVASALVLGGGAGPTAADPTAPTPTVSQSPAPSASGDASETPSAAASTSAPSAPETSADPTAATEPADGASPVPDYVEAPPVALDQEADPGDGNVVRLVGIERIDGQGGGRGEVAGPALAVKVQIENRSDAVLDLNYVVVNLYGPTGPPSPALASDPHQVIFEGQLEPGATASATYVFRSPEGDGPVKVTVSHSADVAAASFEGEVPQ